jgi:23S rRNA G2445 N2-methylase RlmL
MLWRENKTTAEEVHAITRSGVLADDQVQCCTLARRSRWRARAVMQLMRCAVRDQQDIARCQLL